VEFEKNLQAEKFFFDAGSKFAAGIVETGGKFATGINNTSGTGGKKNFGGRCC
jgi:hypothetical protein